MQKGNCHCGCHITADKMWEIYGNRFEAFVGTSVDLYHCLACEQNH